MQVETFNRLKSLDPTLKFEVRKEGSCNDMSITVTAIWSVYSAEVIAQIVMSQNVTLNEKDSYEVTCNEKLLESTRIYNR